MPDTAEHTTKDRGPARPKSALAAIIACLLLAAIDGFALVLLLSTLALGALGERAGMQYGVFPYVLLALPKVIGAAASVLAALLLYCRKPFGMYVGLAVVLRFLITDLAFGTAEMRLNSAIGIISSASFVIAFCSGALLLTPSTLRYLYAGLTDRKAIRVVRAVVGTGVVLMIFFGAVILPSILTFTAAALVSRGTEAPDGSFEERREWGKNVYGTYLEYVDKWAAAAPLITGSVGAVSGIAPTGKPNYYQSCFTDGCYAAMNLEVVGETGRGILYLPHVQVSNYHSPQYSLEGIGEASWTADRVKRGITLSGTSVLEEKGLARSVESFRAAYKREEFSKAVDVFETFRPEVESLPGFIRASLEQQYSEALAAAGRTQDAAAVLAASAKVQSNEARYAQIRRPNEREPDFTARVEGLEQARALLIRAHTIDPSLDLRFEMSSLLTDLRDSRHGLEYSFDTPDLSFLECRKWAKQYLGPFFETAERYIRRSPAVREELGPILYIIPTVEMQNNVALSKKGFYHAFLHLTVRGIFGTGYLKVFIEENPKKVPPVDLFGAQPREPILNFYFRRPRWGRNPRMVDRKLNAKTGELR